MTRPIAAAVFTMFVTLTAAGQDGAADPKALEAKVEGLLKAYNKDDVKAFFTGWAKSVEAITTEATYNALYKGMAKAKLGGYKEKSAKLVKEGSVLSGDFLVVYFDAAFEKGAGKVSVNFQKEGGEYKFLQVQIAEKK